MLSDLDAEIKRIENSIRLISEEIDVLDTPIQSMLTQHVIILTGGLIESSVKIVLSNYARKRGSNQMARYVSRNISGLNSLSKEKIRKVLDNFDQEWWGRLVENLDDRDLDAIDSVKALRDKIAHGRQAGVGFATAKNYFSSCRKFSTTFCDCFSGEA